MTSNLCRVDLNKPCLSTIDTGQTCAVEFNRGSVIEVFFTNLSVNNSAQVTITIGSQAQQPAILQPGQYQRILYRISDYFGSINFFNQAAYPHTLVEISVNSLQLGYNNSIKLCMPEQKEYIVSAYYTVGGLDISRVKQYFPQVSKSESPINLLLSGGSGVIKDRDTVKIETTEIYVGEYKVLGAWRTPTLYYYKGGYDKNQEWTIRKKIISSDSTIYYGDEVYFLNHSYQEQWLCIEDTGRWLTTKEKANVYWLIDQP